MIYLGTDVEKEAAITVAKLMAAARIMSRF